MTDMQFEAAMQKIRSGDKQGLQEIYEEYIGLIYAIVKDVLKSKENAEDVTSDFLSDCGTKRIPFRVEEDIKRG